MKATELLLYAVAGWCGIGVVGTAISLARGRRKEAIRHVATIASLAAVYLLVLLGVSIGQQTKVVAPGQDRCYERMCFQVVNVDEVPGLVVGDEGRVVRVAIQVANRGSSAGADDSIEAYLVDSRGRVWEPLPGLSGNRLNGRISGRAQILSQPMFRVAQDSRGLGLIFTHGRWQRRRLVIGDSESLGHRPTVVNLGR